jgi:glycerol-3-phosphate dehydrogenase
MTITLKVCNGLHLGTNAKYAMLTRTLAKMTTVEVYFETMPKIFLNLSGLEDLIATERINTTHVLVDLANQHLSTISIVLKVYSLCFKNTR